MNTMQKHKSLKFPIVSYCQSGLPMHHISSKCDLLTEDGLCVDSSTDSKVEFHFNALLDAIANQKGDSPEDKSLEGNFIVFGKSIVINNKALYYADQS